MTPAEKEGGVVESVEGEPLRALVRLRRLLVELDRAGRGHASPSRISSSAAPFPRAASARTLLLDTAIRAACIFATSSRSS